MLRFGLLAAGALLLAAPAHAQDHDAEIDEIFGSATPAAPGCAVAVSQHGKPMVNRAYGSADLERDVPITTATRFSAAWDSHGWASDEPRDRGRTKRLRSAKAQNLFMTLTLGRAMVSCIHGTETRR